MSNRAPTTHDIDTAMHWTAAAWDTLADCRDHCAWLYNSWGDVAGNRATASLGLCMISLLAAGPVTITKDGNLDLYIVTPTIHMGMVWHQDTP